MIWITRGLIVLHCSGEVTFKKKMGLNSLTAQTEECGEIEGKVTSEPAVLLSLR